MIRFLSDEDFNRRILRGLRRRLPSLDIVRVQDVGLITRPDTEVLEWAANENRVVLTHDVTTMSKYAFDRVNQNLPMSRRDRNLTRYSNRRSHRRISLNCRMQSGKRMAKSSYFSTAEKLIWRQFLPRFPPRNFYRSGRDSNFLIQCTPDGIHQNCRSFNKPLKTVKE